MCFLGSISLILSAHSINTILLCDASSISLNSGIFNGARVIGPSIAGFLIVLIGTGGAFIVNGLSYIAVIWALLQIRVVSLGHSTHPNPFRAIQAGISYSLAHPIIKILLIFTGMMSIFGWSASVIMPVIAQNVFHVGAAGLGYLYAATGLGAIMATVAVSAFSQKISAKFFILGGNVLFALAITLFTLTSNLYIALIFLFISGFGLLSMFSMINTTIQNHVEDRFRGRVMSLYTIMFLGMTPLGSLQIGFLSEHFGTGFAIRVGALIVFIFGAWVFFSKKEMVL